MSAISRPANFDRKRLGTKAFAVAQRAFGAQHVARDPLLHQRALRVGEGMQHVAPCAGEGPLVAGLLLALASASHLVGFEAGIHRDDRLLVGEEDPVAILLRQVAPRPIDVVAERDEDVALILSLPRHRPRGDRPFANRQRVVRHHRALGHLVDAAETVTPRTGALGRVRREGLGVEELLVGRVVAGARVQHAQQVGQRGDAADRGARARRPALLLQRHRRRQAVDFVDVGHGHLMKQPPGVGRNRFEVSPLRFGVEGAERERRLARAGHAGEDHQRVARNVDVDVLQIVFARAAHVNIAVGRTGSDPPGRRRCRFGEATFRGVPSNAHLPFTCNCRVFPSEIQRSGWVVVLPAHRVLLSCSPTRSISRRVRRR